LNVTFDLSILSFLYEKNANKRKATEHITSVVYIMMVFGILVDRKPYSKSIKGSNKVNPDENSVR